jgi:hypothetical protein
VAIKYSTLSPTVKPLCEKNMKNLVKNATRHLVIKAYETFTKDKKSISVISLPGDVWEFENYVLSNRDFGFKFGGWYALDMALVERDEVTFKRNLAGSNFGTPTNINAAYIVKQYNVTYKNEILNESHVKSCKSNNIFAWFDFCGNPTPENINLINTATGKNVTYIFTFNTAWRMDTNVHPELRNLAAESNKAIATQDYLKILADKLGLTLVWSFEYVSNYIPMISVCFSNDVNVIADKSLSVMNVNKDKKSKITNRTNTPITKAVTVKRDLSAVYVDAKAGIADGAICTKHNITAGTLAAVKAWITMGK